MRFARTALLLAAMTALFLTVGYLIGGTGGTLIAFGAAVAMNLFAYWNSDRMVLSMYGAREIGPQDAPNFYGIVAELARRANMPMPKVYIIESDQPNAFATGRDPHHAAVAATTGLLNRLNGEEVAGVMAHELAHVQNRDTLIMTITATLAGAISMLGNFAFLFSATRSNDENGNSNPLGMVGSLVMMIVAPMAAMLVQMGISRGREYEADRLGAQICGNPLALASALAKLEQGAHATYNSAAERNPATAHMFIINPLHGGTRDNLFSTHPNTRNRIAALEALAAEMGVSTGRSAGFAQPRSPWGQQPPSPPRRGPWG